jgi:hypothetical protein
MTDETITITTEEEDAIFLAILDDRPITEAARAWLPIANVGPMAERFIRHMADQLDEMDSVNRSLGLALEGKFGLAYIERAGTAYPRGIEVLLHTPLGATIAEFMVEWLKAAGDKAPNFIAIDATHPTEGPLSFTLQRCGPDSLTPAQMLARKEKRIADLEDALAEAGAEVAGG